MNQKRDSGFFERKIGPTNECLTNGELVLVIWTEGSSKKVSWKKPKEVYTHKNIYSSAQRVAKIRRN